MSHKCLDTSASSCSHSALQQPLKSLCSIIALLSHSETKKYHLFLPLRILHSTYICQEGFKHFHDKISGGKGLYQLFGHTLQEAAERILTNSYVCKYPMRQILLKMLEKQREIDMYCLPRVRCVTCIPNLFSNLIMGGRAHRQLQLQFTSPRYGQKHIFFGHCNIWSPSNGTRTR